MGAARAENLATQEQITSRIVFSQGGKGGVGKTAFMTVLEEWYAEQGLPHVLIDMDTEVKQRGSLTHYFPSAKKSNVHLARGLDDFVNALEDGASVVLADMGAGSGDVAHEWFDQMYETAKESGVAFTAIGVVTPDPASVSSVLAWGAFLQKRVDYLVVKNSISHPADFGYWDTDDYVSEFRRIFKPRVIEMEYRLPEIENEGRNHGVSLKAIAEQRTEIPALKKKASVWRAQAYRRNLFRQLDSVRDLLVP